MPDPSISLVLPYFNEEHYLAATLASIGAQGDRDFELILIDNGSTDDSDAVARRPARRWVTSQSCGCTRTARARATRCGPVWPRRGAESSRRSMRTHVTRQNTFRAFAAHSPPTARWLPRSRWVGRPAGSRATLKQRLEARLWPRKCHTGGFGQAFRRDLLDAAGGFDFERWPFVLEDHEIVHRIARLGRLAYSADHVCHPSDRRTEDRSGCNWRLWERVQYKLLPGFAMERFFYGYLADRFARRGLSNLRLREKTWG